MYIFGYVLHVGHEFRPPGETDVFCPPDGNRLDVFISHHGAAAESAGARPGLLDRGGKDTILPGQTDRGDLSPWLIQLLSDQFLRLNRPFSLEMGGIPYLHPVVVDPDVDQLR